MTEQPNQPLSKLEKIANALKQMVEIGKSASVLALGLFVLGIFIAPDWTNNRLEKMNLRVESVNTPLIKLVHSEGKSASRNNAIAADAITQALIKVSELLPEAKATEIANNLNSAQKALDAQSRAVTNLARGAGLSVTPISSGWLYLGYFTESGSLGKAGDRIDPTSIQPSTGMPSSVRLKYDAGVVSDGNNCAKTDISKFIPPPADGPDIKYTIIRATNEPLKILKTATCDAAGKGKYLWAKVEVPADRARVGSIGNLGK